MTRALSVTINGEKRKLAIETYRSAWQLQALLTETLIERYDVDRWRNPSAGPWIASDLFGEGQRELAHEQAQRVAGKALTFAPLVRAVERMLS